MPSVNYYLLDSYMFSLTEYLLLFTAWSNAADNTDRIVWFSTCSQTWMSAFTNVNSAGLMSWSKIYVIDQYMY